MFFRSIIGPYIKNDNIDINGKLFPNPFAIITSEDEHSDNKNPIDIIINIELKVEQVVADQFILDK